MPGKGENPHVAALKAFDLHTGTRVRNPWGCGVVFWGILAVPGSAESSPSALSSFSSSVSLPAQQTPAVTFTPSLSQDIPQPHRKFAARLPKNPHPLADAMAWRGLLPDPTVQESSECSPALIQLVAPRTRSQL